MGIETTLEPHLHPPALFFIAPLAMTPHWMIVIRIFTILVMMMMMVMMMVMGGGGGGTAGYNNVTNVTVSLFAI